MCVVIATCKDKKDNRRFIETMDFCDTKEEANRRMESLYWDNIYELLDYCGHNSETGNGIVRNSHIEDGQAWIPFRGYDHDAHFIVLGENDEQYLG